MPRTSPHEWPAAARTASLVAIVVRYGLALAVLILRLMGGGSILRASFIVLFIHVDPRCGERLTDGTVRMTEAAAQGLETGWAWEVSAPVSGSGSFSAEVESAECVSDTVVWWEALASLALAGSAVGVGIVTADRLASGSECQGN